MKYPNRIGYLRKKLGLSQVELGKLVGIPQTHVSAYELGKRPLNQVSMAKFARALKVPIAALLDQVAMGGLRDEVEPLQASGLDAAISAMAAKKRMRLYTITEDSVAEVGPDLAPGAVIAVDESLTPKTGDVVLASIAGKRAEPAAAHRVLRQFVEPRALVTNRPGYDNLIIGLDDPEWHITVLGVVIRGDESPAPLLK
jgi:transcriptional regulator with XRE-family HTH domain